MARAHAVQQGEYLSLIAARYGFRDWRTIYDHADNAEFRRRRPNPNVIFPGDMIAIPDRQPQFVHCATGRSHRFVFKAAKPDELLLVLRACGKPIAQEPCTVEFDDPHGLRMAKRVETATTAADGELRVPLPRGAIHAKVVVTRRPSLAWTIAIGHIDPVRDKHMPFQASRCNVTGVQTRLNNLGFVCGKVDGVLGPRTRAAIGAFQERILGREHGSGALDEETCDRLESDHGC